MFGPNATLVLPQPRTVRILRGGSIPGWHVNVNLLNMCHSAEPSHIFYCLHSHWLRSVSPHNFLSAHAMSFRRESPFPDGRFPPLAPPIPPSHQIIPPLLPQTLSSDEFENLKRSIQLLRISQLRYVVQKFSLPATGNKTRLLRIVLQLIDAMRGSPLLCQISAEVMALLAQQHEPFTNPLESMQKIVLVRPDPKLPVPPEHPLMQKANRPILCGPLVAPQGTSLGTFSFESPRVRSRCCIDFAWQNNAPTPFDMNAHINGFPIAVCGEDPRPDPIDISDYLLPRPQMNVIEFKLVKSPVQLVLCVREYEPQTLAMLMARVAGKPSVDPLRDVITVKGKACSHEDAVPLGPFLVKAIVTGTWTCPVCGGSMNLEEMNLVSFVQGGHGETLNGEDWDQFIVMQ